MTKESKFLDPKNDISFKKIFGVPENKDILIHFINDIMGYQGEKKVKDVTFLNPIQNPIIASKKQSIVDVLCKDAKGSKFIVEMQISPQRGFEKRAQYYAAKAYFGQLNKGQTQDGLYSSLKEVIFIAIIDETLFHNKKAFLSRHKILDEITYENDLQDFSFTFLELPKFTLTKVEELKTIVDKWCYFFKFANQTSYETLKKLYLHDPMIYKACKTLNKFNWTEKELDAYEAVQKSIWDQQAIYDEYTFRGEKEGEEKKALAIAKKMLSDQFSIDHIIKYTSLTKDQLKEIMLL